MHPPKPRHDYHNHIPPSRKTVFWLHASFLTTNERIARGIREAHLHVSVAKQLCDGVYGQQIRQGMNNELLAISMLYKTDDRREARTARNEGRKPTFTGL